MHYAHQRVKNVQKTEQLKTIVKQKGLNYVGTRGPTSSPIWFIGEAPGADEDQQGVPFVGASGRELGRMIQEVSLTESDCCFTNPYKVRPLENKLERIDEFGVDRQLFLDQFFEELNDYKPTFIIALGATPLGILCPFTIPKRKNAHAEISKYRGSLLCSPSLSHPHYVVPAYHPAYLFRDWSERQNDVLCLAKVREEYDYWKSHNNTLQPLPQRRLIAEPAADDAIDFLNNILQSPTETVVSIDIENIGRYKGKDKTAKRNRVPYVIGFSIDPLEGISIGLGEYDQTQAIKIWKMVDNVLRLKKQVYQNGTTHDIPWLSYIGFSPNLGLCEDTLVMHSTLWPELSHKLDFLTFQYTREVYYKDEASGWSVKDRQRMKRYNIKDVCVTLECYYAMKKEFLNRG